MLVRDFKLLFAKMQMLARGYKFLFDKIQVLATTLKLLFFEVRGLFGRKYQPHIINREG